MSALCLAAAGVAVAHILLPAAGFTLSWTHSVERVRWEEDYRVAGDRLELVEARVQGSGAGMEPPEGAVLEDGWWRYRPALPLLPELTLADSGFGGAHQLCVAGTCRPLAHWLSGPAVAASPVHLRACAAPAGPGRGG